MFNSIFQNGTTGGMLALMAALALVVGGLYAFLASLKLRSSKGMLITLAILPVIVATGIALIDKFLGDSDSTSGVAKVATVAIALGLVRFRSVNGRAEEMLLVLGSVVGGFIFGLGYAAYAVIFFVVAIGLYLAYSYLPIFGSKRRAQEKLLKITIPETLNYSDVFQDAFAKYLKEYESVGVKTTGMGSMFRLSFRVVLKNPQEEKALIDELRTKNGNLEISLLPYVEELKGL